MKPRVRSPEQKVKSRARSAAWSKDKHLRRHLAVLADVERKVDSRWVWPPEELAWAAGCFEGEGTATITRSMKHTRTIISLANTDREIVDFYNSRWPGSVTTVNPRKPQHKTAWVWVLNSRLAILCFVADVRPYLQTEAEREKFRLIARIERIRRQGSRDPELKIELEAARAQMAILNRKGPKLLLPAVEA